jgi:hypothetical protein
MKNNFAQGLYEVSTTKKENLGTLRVTPDGRKFRYAYCGATQLEVGVTTTMLAATADHVNISVAAAAAIGDMTVSVTTASTAITADAYADGYFQVNSGTGCGHQYLIDSNTSCATSGTSVITLRDPIRVALVTAATTEVSLIPNPWNGTVIMATSTSAPAGIPVTVVPINNYYWSQTGGHACIWADGGCAVGSIQRNGDTSGQCLLADGYTEGFIGTTIATVMVTDEHKPIWMCID